MIKCEECGRWFGTKKGCNIHKRIHKDNQKQIKESIFDMNEIKLFITSEIQTVLKEFDFSRSIDNNNTKDIEILPIRIKKMPKFNLIETNKHLLVKELKEELAKGIKNVLHDIGSFDNQINFYEVPVEILA